MSGERYYIIQFFLGEKYYKILWYDLKRNFAKLEKNLVEISCFAKRGKPNFVATLAIIRKEAIITLAKRSYDNQENHIQQEAIVVF